MAHVFRIHNHYGNNANVKPVDAAGVQGWTRTQYYENLKNNAIDVGTTVGNIGTSIPNIFARIMLFSIAFKETGKEQHNNVSANTRIISECLDMLELLFQKGRDTGHLIVKKWDANAQIQILNNSGNGSLKKLGKVLNENLGVIGSPTEIYLFYWRDTDNHGKQREVLIGGTSPLTLVFTSPNWVRELGEYGWSDKFKRTTGGKMFDQANPLALDGRVEEFRNMMFDLRMAYSADLQNQAKGLYQYIIDTITNLHADVAPINTAQFSGNEDSRYIEISRGDGIGKLQAKGIPLVYKPIKPNDNYVMVPTKNLAAGVKTPMALTDEGLGNTVPYIGGQPWHAVISDAYVREKGIYDRELPGGMGVEYPFVCAYDFFEEKIIKIEAPVNRNKFLTLTGNAANGQPINQEYLIPLKPKFFEFFGINDLKNMMRITTSGDEVVVSLAIPIKDSTYQKIIMKKVYDANHIVSVNNSQIGVYPFYRVTDRPGLNKYAVVSTSTPRLSFFTEAGVAINSQPTERTKREGLNVSTNYYMVDSAFDYIVLEENGVKGMIIPQMQEITIANATVDYKFAIDFGTSNTMVAYRKNAVVPQELDINSSDYAVYLHQHIGASYAQIDREFMPTSLDGGDNIKFPVKTAVCEKIGYHAAMGNVELFGKINAGFNFMKENVYSSGSYEYITDLKWSLEKNSGNIDNLARVRHFCMGILWLVKNVALSGQGKDDFTVLLTFPQSMLGIGVILGAWQWAAQQLGLNNVTFDTSVSESEAPYYKMVTAACDMLNVDIGGGTTDMFFVVKSAMPAYCRYQSVRFAANDLWDDGYGVGIGLKGSNGFVQYLKDSLLGDGTDITDLVNTTSSSADVMAVLFSRDNTLNTSNKIMAHNDLKSILVLHFTALLFHIARIIKRQNLPIPRDITFSGMGSLYIGLFSTSIGLMTDFVKDVLAELTGKNVPAGFNLRFGTSHDAKQNTALGALAKDLIVHAAPAFDLTAMDKTIINEQGLGDEDGDEDAICYQDVVDDAKNGNIVYENSKAVFNKFINYLRSRNYNQLVGNKLGFGIKGSIINDLQGFGEQSYTNVKAQMPTSNLAATINDSLFFWHIKDALYQLSVNLYQQPVNIN